MTTLTEWLKGVAFDFEAALDAARGEIKKLKIELETATQGFGL